MGSETDLQSTQSSLERHNTLIESPTHGDCRSLLAKLQNRAPSRPCTRRCTWPEGCSRPRYCSLDRNDPLYLGKQAGLWICSDPVNIRLRTMLRIIQLQVSLAHVL